MEQQKIAEAFMHLFRGQDRAHGVYDMSQAYTEKEGTKTVGKAITKRGAADVQVWLDHLQGKIGLGIIPIQDDATCFFGAIDIDVYVGLDANKLIEDIYTKDLPLVPIRSKSGGLHLYLFMREAVKASLLREKLRLLAAFLGHGEAEIFPKQAEVLTDRGDFGSWINMPYFDMEHNTTRYAYGRIGDRLTAENFLLVAEKRSLSAPELSAYRIQLLADLCDGPPCLQTILSNGVEAGTRNRMMFNLCVYLKKVAGENDITPSALELNLKHLHPPLETQEILTIIKSRMKKNYRYSCSESPMKDHCNLPLCRVRKYGVGGLIGMPEFNALAKYDTRPPIWFLTTAEGKRMELSTMDLLNQQRFQKCCMDQLNVCPVTVNASLWHNIVHKLMESVTVIEAPVDASERGAFYDLLEFFCVGKAQARSPDEILLGRPYWDKDTGKHIFRMRDLNSYLVRERFSKALTLPELTMLIRDIGGRHEKRRIKNTVVNVWTLPEMQQSAADFAAPAIPGEGAV